LSNPQRLTTRITHVVCRNALPDKSWFREGALAKELPIQVDEDEQTVTVEGGVQTRVLLDYLAHYM
jgi:FAD/FMN-containing dehydrogenase